MESKKFDEWVNENESTEEIGETESRSIELDCAPGSPRPDDLFPGVIADTGLEEEDFEIVSKVFGNWEFALKNKSKIKEFDEAKSTFEKRVTALYKSGKIRYGSW
jgi:hypothetical protein